MVDVSGEPTRGTTERPSERAVGSPVASPWRRGAAAVPAATTGANLLSYLLLLAAARVLNRADYGELVAELGVLLVGTVAALALQTVAARRTATGTPAAGLMRTALLLAALAAGVVIALAPLLQRFLHLGSPVGLLAVAAALPATAILGAHQGFSQGRRRFGRLAAVIACTIGGRSVGGLIGVLIGRSPAWCLVGVAVGTTLALAGVWRWLGPPDRPPDGPPVVGQSQLPPAGRVWIEVGHAAHAHGAFLLLTSLDVLLARHVLDADAAGIYAVGSVVTRAALWLPQSVAMVMFASLTDGQRHRHALSRAVAAVAALAGLTITGCATLGHLVVSVVGGPKYHALDGEVWLFATLGAALALTQLAIMAGLAVGRRGRITLVWMNAVADVVAVLVVAPGTPLGVVLILTAISAATAAACLALSFAGGRNR